jgi:hypothetical protein
MLTELYKPTRFWPAVWFALVLLLSLMAPRLQSRERVELPPGPKEVPLQERAPEK